jgi:HK97 family phage prohead protease
MRAKVDAVRDVELVLRSTEVTRDVPELSLRAEVGEVDDEKRTVSLTWSTGERVLRGFFSQYWEELSLDPKHVRMSRLRSGAPLLDNHDRESGAVGVIGVVTDASVDGKRGTATVRFARAEDDPVAEQVFRKVKDKIVRNVSVGYRVHKMEKIEDGEGKVPVYRAVDWEPYEISFVPIGADGGAGVRGLDSSTNRCTYVDHETNTREREMAKPSETPVTGEQERSSAEEAARQAAARRSEESKKQREDAQRQAEDAVAAERVRVAEIRRIVRRAKLGDDLAETWIKDGTAVEAAREAAFNRMVEDDGPAIDGHARVEAGDDEAQKFVRVASAALMREFNVAATVREAAKTDERFRDVQLDAQGFPWRGIADLARRCLERRGQRVDHLDRFELVKRAIMTRGVFQTTSDFAVILENVLYKQLLGTYAITPDTWSMFCGTDTVEDFRPSNRFRLGALTALDRVYEHAEFKNKAIPDGVKFAISAWTYGNILALSRQTIINDDMGALVNVAAAAGRAAKLTVEAAVYALLLLNSGLGPTQGDGQPFFHANRANVNATGSALSVAGVEADAVVMANQKDPANQEYLALDPYALLVPRALKGTAQEINDAQFDFDNAGTNTTGKFMRPNRVRGLFRQVVGTPRITGTRRYLFADPSVAPALVVAFLAGQGQSPVLDSDEGWRVDGVEWKVRLDFGAQAVDGKGAVTNAGA